MPEPHDLNRLAAFAEGRLDAAERAELTEHVASCAECRTILAALIRTDDRQRSAAVTLWSRARAYFGPDRPQWRMWVPIAATLAVAALAIDVVWIRNARPFVVAPSVAQEPAPTSTSADQSEGLLTRRGGASRHVAGKEFRLVAGEWIDADYDVALALPVVHAATPEQRTRVLAGTPALQPYATLGDRVTVVYNGTVYRFGQPPQR